ncbi:hypothetical protein ElyMa_004530000 [Elysia marginata]|uniref:Uncharacterized protein n=1 Tax=Elysia marginata TaxID=1093978 RepID=A0AAV4HNL5_9GAST|nr:hypothetical protein ElyMa_004530000 [Elysia marginata]
MGPVFYHWATDTGPQPDIVSILYLYCTRHPCKRLLRPEGPSLIRPAEFTRGQTSMEFPEGSRGFPRVATNTKESRHAPGAYGHSIELPPDTQS